MRAPKIGAYLWVYIFQTILWNQFIFSIHIIEPINNIFVNFHVFNSSKNNLPPNKTIMKIATMSGRGLLVIVLIAAAIAFY
mgnify:CR=1 FL=1